MGQVLRDHMVREARAVPSSFVGVGAALCEAKGISSATGRKSSLDMVGSGSQYS
jgi:hypothetical protein